MIDRVEGFDEIDEYYVGFEVVFSAELDGGFEREDGVRASFIYVKVDELIIMVYGIPIDYSRDTVYDCIKC